MSRDAVLARAITPNRRLMIRCDAGVYTTRVETVEEGHFTTAAPFAGSVSAPIRPGERVEVWVPVATGLVCFLAPVLGRRVEGVPVLVMAWPAAYHRHQRREYVRTEKRVPALITLRGDLRRAGLGYPAYTRNLSGGGVQVRVTTLDPRLVSTGQAVTLTLDLGDCGEPVHAEGRVVRKHCLPGCGQAADIAIAFERISPRDRSRLCRHINDHQIDLRRKGLL